MRANLQTQGVAPYNMCVLNGFPTALAKTATTHPRTRSASGSPNATTLYVADEGDGDNAYSAASNSYTAAAASTTAGLQKWVLNTTTHTWSLAYTLQAGLNLGVPYTVKNYPTGNNAATGLPWSPATDGLRNLTGHVNRDGTVTHLGDHLHRERRRRPGRRSEQARDDHRQARRDHAAGKRKLLDGAHREVGRSAPRHFVHAGHGP